MQTNVSGILAERIFADGNFAERNFRRTEFSPSEFSPNGILAENYEISQGNFRMCPAYFIMKCF